MSDLALPPHIGRFRILRELGRGGMGVVYAAIDEDLERTIALKVISSTSLDIASRQRFQREARMLAALSHPSVCRLYEFGEDQGRMFLAMELLEGELLSDRLHREPMTCPQAIEVMEAILGAVSAMHQIGIVHRDLKPENVMLTTHGVRLLDFGLAKRCLSQGEYAATETQTVITREGMLAGSPHYMAPELVQGNVGDLRGDLFAAGAILYEMLSGRRAFQGQNVVAALHAVVYDEPPALAGSPQIAALDRTIRRALAKHPEARYASAEAFRADLRHAAQVYSSAPTGTARTVRRLIVLPFRALRHDDETDFLTFSLPDAITAELSKLKSLVVRSTLAGMRFSGPVTDLKALATEAAVDVALTGTLLRAGNEIRVSTQLLELPEGTLINAHTAQAGLRDILQLQDELVRRIVASLSLELTPAESAQLRQDMPASATVHDLYLRANQLSYDRPRMPEARDLYRKCVKLDPNYAPAWARMGRCYRLLAKYNEAPRENLQLSREALDRALALNSELDIAHSYYAQLQTDLGQAPAAMMRLVSRASANPNSSEIFAGLVYACRFCGLLRESVACHDEARRLDPGVPSSVTQTYFHLRNFLRCLETYSGDIGYIDALALDGLGNRDEAVARLRARFDAGRLTPMSRLYVGSLLRLFEGRMQESAEMVEAVFADYFLGPEEIFYLARQLIRTGELERGLNKLEESVKQGYYCVNLLATDPWMEEVRTLPEFRALQNLAIAGRETARRDFESGGGPSLLGQTAC